MKILKSSTILAAAGALTLAVSAQAQVDAPKDVVKSTGGRVVVNSFNNCVVTKWDATADECDAGVGGSLELRTVYFDFDSAVLTPAAKAKLDVLANGLKSQSAKKVRIVGFADKIGTTGYNNSLSQRRANAVSRYLAGKGLTVEGNYEVRGLGETASQSKCEGVNKRSELIACLWRDRRVEVEVVN
jgi:OOP family OmpA-OmpF porin